MSPCQTFIETLRTRGYRITSQRKMIVEAIAHSGNHVSAEQVFAQIQHRTKTVNIATVYRTLDLLVAEGLANHIDLGQGRVIYAPYQHGPHIHLVCQQCGRVTDADQNLLQDLKKQLNTSYQFTAYLQHISIPGLCSECRAKL